MTPSSSNSPYQQLSQQQTTPSVQKFQQQYQPHTNHPTTANQTNSISVVAGQWPRV